MKENCDNGNEIRALIMAVPVFHVQTAVQYIIDNAATSGFLAYSIDEERYKVLDTAQDDSFLGPRLAFSEQEWDGFTNEGIFDIPECCAKSELWLATTVQEWAKFWINLNLKCNPIMLRGSTIIMVELTYNNKNKDGFQLCCRLKGLTTKV